MEGRDQIEISTSSRVNSSSVWRDNGMEVIPSSSSHREDDEAALKWASLERLPTYNRLRKGLLTTSDGKTIEIDVNKLGFQERKNLLEKLVTDAEVDNERFLLKLKDRIERVGIEIPTIEVRFEHLNVEADVHVGSRALPTFFNYCFKLLEGLLTSLHILSSSKKHLTILQDVSGIIRPCRMTLLLGPPNSGKTTLLLSLAGKIHQNLKFSGKVTYNGFGMNEFVPQRTAAYISEQDLHMPEMTVRETLAFSARCQGVGTRHEWLAELARREKAANVMPDPDIDIFMKAAAAVSGQESTVFADYILKILGLEICAETMVGDEMLRGISGGQRKRVTTGEMLVGPANAFFMDEISTGLDSSTTFQIVNSLKQYIHILKGTAIISLLQPAPKTYELFDDIILLSDGQIVYQGPREHVLEFFEFMGFKCPERKGVADFLQEELCKACFSREFLLMKRNTLVYVFKLTQLTVTAAIYMTIFLRTEMHRDSATDGTIYMGALFLTLVMSMFNGLSEITLTVRNLPVFYKQRDLLFFPAWLYALPTWLLKIPVTFIEVSVWVIMTYYVVGYDPDVRSFLKQYLLLFLVHQMGSALFRFLAAVGRNPVVSNTVGAFTLLILFVNGGFVLARENVKKWWIWGYWMSPMMYGQNAIAVNEFLGNGWRNVVPSSAEPLGVLVLKSRGFFPYSNWYWIGVVALTGFIILFNIGYILALTYLNPLEKPQTFRSEDYEINEEDDGAAYRSSLKDNAVGAEQIRRSVSTKHKENAARANHNKEKGMVLPFEPYSLIFENVIYSVDMPMEMRNHGVLEDKLVLLKGVSGAFRPGILTALMGISGAGKTTLLDVLAGRKTGGYIEGNIKVNGYPKKQETFARISGYCEQNDIHSPQVTVHESLIYSAWLRLHSDVNTETRKMFIEKVMELVELNTMRQALVGLPGVSGLSTEQRKRLTIAVELVANPSVIFMDEPTSGLDARAAAIVMRTVRNTVDTGRTVVCTIHQPSIDIFEAFDEVFLLRRGGEEIYVGPLGLHSSNMIQYFEGIRGVSKIKDGYNPATWMLEVTSSAQELALGVDFADVYKNSDLYRRNRSLNEELNVPLSGSKEIYFPTQYSLSFYSQCSACLWKQRRSYWRNSQYTAVRFFFTTGIALMFGTMFWDLGSKKANQQDLYNSMGSMYTAALFLGIQNCVSVLPVVSIERTVFYRERAAGMYSALAYAFAQILVEIPYIFVQSIVYAVIVYSMMGFEWTAAKFLWYLFFMFFTFMYCTFYGMMTVAVTPNHIIASIISTAFFAIWNLFSGFIVPQPRIPVWWRWYYWACPLSWTLYGLFASQFGDNKNKLDTGETVQEFMRDFFGFRHDFLGIVAVAIVGFSVLFAFVFAISIKIFNFQKR
ncbi:Pleiotropic drug resistance ABC transporter [Quillaja saponaria]|uniref:Pleiotropic drug resistance ABC transporter n=1 Tax=Quillaja saponaria TaxID=32244 RepID=A0AAD7LTQ7_QUISA|nr:Pleiotropic drug resistance ABC transporter [Quillaja saponaria]